MFEQLSAIPAPPESAELATLAALPELAPLKTELELLLSAASSGDMAATRAAMHSLSAINLGAERLQHLQLALRQYDLARVEQLLQKWLAAS